MRGLFWFLCGFGLVLISAVAMGDNAAPCSQNQTSVPGQTLARTSAGSSGGLTWSAGPYILATGLTTTAKNQAAGDAGWPTVLAGLQAYYPGQAIAKCSMSVGAGNVTYRFTRGTAYPACPGASLPVTIQTTTNQTWCTDNITCQANQVGKKLASFTNVGAAVPLAVCDNAEGFGSNCTALAVPGSTTCGAVCGTLYKTISETCTVGVEKPAPSTDAVAPAPAEVCVTNGAAEYCIASTPDSDNSQCGYLNDKFICLNNTPKGGCQGISDGGLVCDAAANTAPPLPDNGTLAVPAAADGQVKADTASANTINNYNYYSSTTVAGSAGAPQTGQPQGIGNNGDTNGDGYVSPEEEEGGIPCDGGNCFSGALQETVDLDSVTSQYWSRVENAPIIAAMSGLSASVPTGSCPTFPFTLWGTTFNISAGCEFMPDIAPILSLAFMAGWCLLGVRIVLSA